MASLKKNSAHSRVEKGQNRTCEYPNTQLSSSDSQAIYQKNALSSGNIAKNEVGGLTDSNEMRMIVIGKTGTGKSATGNTILGMSAFDSKVCASSVTSKCRLGMNTRFDRKFVIVDTPGLFDTEMTNEKVTMEIVKCIGMTAPGPHAIILTVNVGRFTKEEHDTVKHFVGHFGDDMYKYLIVVFTRADELEKEKVDIKDYVSTCPKFLRGILEKCDQRYIPFNNRLSGYHQEQQVKQLISKVDEVVHNNGGNYYTNEMYEEAEKTLQRHEEELKKQIQAEEELKRKQLRSVIENEFKSKLNSANSTIISLKSDITSINKQKDAADTYAEKLNTKIISLNSDIKSIKDKTDATDTNAKIVSTVLEQSDHEDKVCKSIQEANKTDSEQSDDEDEICENTYVEEREDYKKKLEEKERELKVEYDRKYQETRDACRRACEKEEGLLTKIVNGLKRYVCYAKGVINSLFGWI